MSSNPLTPSFRRVHRIPKDGAHQTVRDAIHDNDQSITDISQAIEKLKGDIDTNTKNISTILNEEIASQTVTPSTPIGNVNNQIGNTFYSTQQSDEGSKVLFGDSTPVTCSLTPGVSLPWFTILGNDSTARVNITSTSAIRGILKIDPGCFVFVHYDGTTFWSEGVQFAADSTPGLVYPDDVTCDVDSTSGQLYTIVGVGGGPPSGTPNTPGNPFYFDSTVSPWNGYVYANGGWNRFS